jgi:hypothetical protein
MGSDRSGALSWLDLEMQRAARVLNWAAVQELDAMGVPRAVAAQATAAGDIGLMRVSVGHDGLFEPDGSEGRLILAVREYGVLIDQVASSRVSRDSWALRTGQGWCLGFAAFADARLGLRDRLRVLGNPIEWLISGMAGICVLDWSHDSIGQLRGLGSQVTLECEPGAEHSLRDILARDNLPAVVPVKAWARA